MIAHSPEHRLRPLGDGLNDRGSPFLTFYQLFKSVFLDRISRPLGYEPRRVVPRLSCSSIYVLLVGWFFLLAGQFCGRNVVEDRLNGSRLPSGELLSSRVERHNIETTGGR